MFAVGHVSRAAVGGFGSSFDQLGGGGVADPAALLAGGQAEADQQMGRRDHGRLPFGLINDSSEVIGAVHEQLVDQIENDSPTRRRGGLGIGSQDQAADALLLR
jgi:hypothetical protein